MLIRTWGFVATKPHSPWVSVEVRAERGALVRTSGLPPGAAQKAWLDSEPPWPMSDFV